jgi:hypothetical protein
LDLARRCIGSPVGRGKTLLQWCAGEAEWSGGSGAGHAVNAPRDELP